MTSLSKGHTFRIKSSMAFMILSATASSLVFSQPSVEKVHNILQILVFDQSNKKPFHEFIEEMITTIENDKEAFTALIPDSIAKNKAQYLHDFLKALKKIKTSNDVSTIATTLNRYKIFAPDFLLKNRHAAIEGLKLRLAMQHDSSDKDHSIIGAIVAAASCVADATTNIFEKE